MGFQFGRLDGSEVLKASTEDLVKIFQLENESLLIGRIQLIEVPMDSLLGLEGDLESCVYFIATGKLKVFRHTGEHESARTPQVGVVLYLCDLAQNMMLVLRTFSM